MTSETREKSFDCVKWTRERRNQMYEETKGMSPEERRRWSESRRPMDPLLAELYDGAKPPAGSRWHDQGSPAVGRAAGDAHTTGEHIVTEIMFEVSEDEVDGGYTASAPGCGIHTRGGSIEEVRVNVKETVDCYLEDTMPLPRPKFIRLRFVRDEVIEV